MQKRNLGWGLVVGGAILQIVSLSADYLGIGQQLAVIGWKQLMGAAIGLVVILVGAWVLSRDSNKVQ